MGQGVMLQRACLQETPQTSQSVRPSAQATLTAQHASHCVRQVSKTEMVHGGGGGATALVDEGVVKGLCVYASTHNSPAMCRACILGNGCAHSFPSSLPAPGVRLTFFLTPRLGHARLPCRLPPPQPFIHCLTLCLTLCLPLTHLVLTKCREGTPNKASGPQQGISTMHVLQ